MGFETLILRNLRRSGMRTSLTICAIALAVVTFLALRTVIDAWHAAAQYAAKERLMTVNRVSYGRPIPLHYVRSVARDVPGIRSVTHCEWFAGRWAKDPNQFFANLACADNAFEVYPEISVAPAALERWKRDKQGAIIGDLLAEQLGLRVGDRVKLVGSFYPGDWEFTIAGLYTAPAHSAVDRSSFFFRWDYKNERVPASQKDQTADGRPVVEGELVALLILERRDGAGNANVQLRGVTQHVWSFRPSVRILEGRALTPGASEAIVGKALVGQFRGLQVGETISLRHDHPLRVVGIFDDQGSAHESEIWADRALVATDLYQPGALSSCSRSSTCVWSRLSPA